MKIDWLKYRWIYFLISLVFIVPGVYSLARWGINPAIDFTGGTLLEVSTKEEWTFDQNKEINNMIMNMDLKLESLHTTGDKTILMRLDPVTEDEKEQLISNLEEDYGTIEIIRYETLGPSLGKELLLKTGISLGLAILGILIYVTLQFKDKSFGICAILAMIHDSLILIGSYSLLGYFYGVEIGILLVTVIITTLSFSVHDTVVVYNRIAELIKNNSKNSFDQLANQAIDKTLVRSINDSLTIIFMLVALSVLGGSTIHWFAVALLIGTIAGTYSSTFTAIPLLSLWHQLFDKN